MKTNSTPPKSAATPFEFPDFGAQHHRSNIVMREIIEIGLMISREDNLSDAVKFLFAAGVSTATTTRVLFRPDLRRDLKRTPAG
jgi:hypothetical protein